MFKVFFADSVTTNVTPNTTTRYACDQTRKKGVRKRKRGRFDGLFSFCHLTNQKASFPIDLSFTTK